MIDQIPDWWPHRSASRITAVENHIWHSQTLGTQGPKILLLHGTGASTHSWAGLVDIMKDTATLCAVDLPGHGFSTRPRLGLSTLEACTLGLIDYLAQTKFVPDIIIGHSAGAAIAAHLAPNLSQKTQVFCINAAFGEFPGLAGIMFPYLAKLAALAPFSPSILTYMAQDRARVQRLLAGTGSQVPQASLRAYCALFQSQDHVKGTLQLMAEWDLKTFLRTLTTLPNQVTFLTGMGDKTVPAQISRDWAQKMPNARIIEHVGYGHLIQEEAPSIVAEHISATLKRASP